VHGESIASRQQWLHVDLIIIIIIIIIIIVYYYQKQFADHKNDLSN